MCGRYSAGQLSLPLLAERFQADPAEAAGHKPSWNVTPTSQVLAVTPTTGTRRAGPGGGQGATGRTGDGAEAGGAGGDGAAASPRRLRRLRWGLVPGWAKDLSVGNRMINVRAETVASKPTFSRLLRGRRCILPADGFYEWQDLGPDADAGTAAGRRRRRKQPFYITSRDGEPLALAGLWTTWRNPAAEQPAGDQPSADQQAGTAGLVASCAIITTDANRLMASIHTRMPVLLPARAWDTWLDPDLDDVDALTGLLVPAPDDLLTLWPVDPAVNSPRSNGPELTRPLEGHQPGTWS